MSVQKYTGDVSAAAGLTFKYYMINFTAGFAFLLIIAVIFSFTPSDTDVDPGYDTLMYLI